jgi:hypothetical protein
MALTPGTGSNSGMGLRPRRKWDKWTRWMVTSECQTACGGHDSRTNQNVPCVTRGRHGKDLRSGPPPLIKDIILRGAWKRPGAVDRSAYMIVVQINALFYS